MIETLWDGVVASIRLNRPDKKNALTPPMLDEFTAHIAATRGKARAVVVCGAGDAFCSGFDLAMCLESAEVLRTLLQGLSRAIAAMRDHPSPIVLAAHGAAIAGGCALLGGADVVITNHAAKLGYPVVKLGISPAVSAPFLSQSIGFGAARTRQLDPQLITGTEALRVGLAHECLATPGEVQPRALAIAKELAAKPRCGVEATKAWMNQIDHATTAAPQALEASTSLVGGTEERELLARALVR